MKQQLSKSSMEILVGFTQTGGNLDAVKKILEPLLPSSAPQSRTQRAVSQPTTPITRPVSNTSNSSGFTARQQQSISLLVEMGYSRDHVIKILEVANWNVERAMEFLS